MTLTQNLSKTWKRLFKVKKFFWLAVLFDLLFFVALSQVYWVFFTPATEAALQASDFIQQEMEKLAETTDLTELNEMVMQNPEFVAAYHKLLELAGLFLLVSLIAWIVFKSFAWYFSYQNVKKVKLKKFFLNFLIRSIFWFFALIFYLFFMFWVLGKLTFAQTTGISALSTILWAGFFALLYFAQLSLASIPQKFKNAFILGVKYARKLVFVYVFNLLLVIALLALSFYAVKFSPYAGFAIFFILFLPSLAFTRTNLLVATWLKQQ